MHCMSKKLLALALAALFAPVSAFAQDGSAVLSGKIEAGAAGVAVSDEKTRVNEYSVISPDPGVNAYEKADIFMYDPRGITIKGNSSYMGSHDQDHDFQLEFNGVLRNSFDYQSFEHQLDHQQFDYLNAATIRKTAVDPNNTPIQIGGADKLPAYVLIETDPVTGEEVVLAGGGNYNPKGAGGLTNESNNSFLPFDSNATDDAFTLAQNQRIQQTGGAMMKGEDLVPNQYFSIVYREWTNETEFTYPSLPNLTFDLKFRHQEREGIEQSIGMSKCAGCHITGESRRVDEVTEDVTAGVTGKFGLLTLRYAFTDREFDGNADDPARIYDVANKPGQSFDNRPFDNRLGYDYLDGALPYDVTPDSDKQSHVFKAKLDLPGNTVVLGNYVNAEIESTKREEPGIFTLSDNKLTTTYDNYGMRASTWLGGLKLAAHAKYEELENDDVVISIDPISTSGGAGLGAVASSELHRESVITREVLTAGVEGMYRFGRYTTARLGYEYEEEDREEEHFGKTETNTVEASLHARPLRNVSGRISYKYQDIENPFHLPHAAGVPLTENTYGTLVGNGAPYGTVFYAARDYTLSNQPEEVHEAKLSATWAPLPRFAATATYRYKGEENELNQSTWEQDTHSPGVSMWYAASDRMNFTFAYNYFDQRTETAFCQGYYDG